MSEPVKPSENPATPSTPPAAASPPANSEAAKAAPAAAAKPAAAAVPAKPAAPAMPPKPAAPPKAGAKAGATRRGFLSMISMSWLGLAWTAFAASMAGMTFGTLRFMFPNVLSEPPAKVKVGFPESFEDGKVNERFKDQNIWVVHYKGKIYALSTTCTHLGCTPNWLESAQKFKCPCHGSGFYITGINFEGPAPRPLERWAISVGDDGQLVVDKSKKFQQELGQWDNPESYVSV
jgi:cytochrome b6-f complex iron-sulfur subunit